MGSSTKKGPLAPQAPQVLAASGPPMQVTALPPDRGTLRPKGSTAAGGASGTKANRSQAFERQGARHRIEVSLFPARAPEAAATQANGRIIQSYAKFGNQYPSFSEEAADKW